MLIIKNMTINTIFWKNCITLHNYLQSFYFHQYFHYILQLIYQLFSFDTYNFYNLSILLHHMIYHVYIGFQINPLSHIPLSINSLHSHLHLSLLHLLLLLQTLSSSLHLHLEVSCHSICIVSLFLDIRLNTLRFIF